MPMPHLDVTLAKPAHLAVQGGTISAKLAFVLVLRWYWSADVLLACGPGLDPPDGSTLLGVSVLSVDEAILAAEVDRLQREALDLN
jgi:hypothetical protein